MGHCRAGPGGADVNNAKKYCRIKKSGEPVRGAKGIRKFKRKPALGVVKAYVKSKSTTTRKTPGGGTHTRFK
jgi:hypothetical protein